jgi:hypothetical protein
MAAEAPPDPAHGPLLPELPADVAWPLPVPAGSAAAHAWRFAAPGLLAEVGAAGILRVELNDGVARGGLAPAGAEVVAVRLGPCGAERELRIGGRAVLERILVGRAVPLLLVEWSAPAGAELRLPALDDAAPAPLPAALADRIAFQGPALLADAGTRGAAGGAFHLEPGTALRMAIGPGIGAARAGTDPFHRPELILAGRLTHARRIERDALRVSTPVPEVDAAIRRALHQVAELPEPDPPASAAARGCALVAIGRCADAAALLERWAARPAEGALLSRLRLAARYVAGAGPDELGPRAHHLVRAGELPDPRTPGAAAVLLELADAAEALGDIPRAAALRLLAGPADPGQAPEPAPLSVAELAAPAPPADRILAVAERLLGMRPDAARGRLRLRPAPPAEWDRLDAQRMHVGPATIDLAYRRTGDLHRFRIEQTTGPAPIRLILEPLLAIGRLRAATVDGAPATLAARRVADRVLVPLQIMLDHPREVELHAAGDPADVRSA